MVTKFTITYLLTLQMLHTKFGKDWPSSSWEEVNGRRRSHGRLQPIAISHLSDSGDLKIKRLRLYIISKYLKGTHFIISQDIIHQHGWFYSVFPVPGLLCISCCHDNNNNNGNTMSQSLFHGNQQLYQHLLQNTIKHHQQHWKTRRHGSKHPPKKKQLLWHVSGHL